MMTDYEIRQLLANKELKREDITQMTASQINEHWEALKDIIQGVSEDDKIIDFSIFSKAKKF